MQNLYIEETQYTPMVQFDVEKRVLELIGRSYPENTFEFYQPILDWMESYFKQDISQRVTVNLELIYLNSSTSKIMFDFLDLIEEGCENGFDVVINWIYDVDNDTAQDSGLDYQEDFESLNFNLIQK